MDFQVKEIEYCKLNIACQASLNDINDAHDKVMSYVKNVEVPGFRKGKAPTKVIKHHYKDSLNEYIKAELCQMAYENSLNQHDIRPFGNPQFISSHLEGGNFKCEFSLHKIPSVELKEYKNFELPRGNVPDANEMSEQILQELRVLNGDTLRFEDNDFIQIGDSAIINYKGFVEEKTEPVITMEGENFVVGKADVEAFNENLLGMRIGEIREFTVKMPPNASAIHIANQTVRFVVELGMASKRILPALDDTFAEKVGCKSIEDLMSKIKSMASVRCEEIKIKHLNMQVGERLIEAHDFAIPDWLSVTEARWIANQNGANWDKLDDSQKKGLIDIAAKNVKLSIILDKIRQEEPEAQMTDEEVHSTVVNNISQFKTRMPNMHDKTDSEVLQAIQEAGFLPSLMSSIKDEYTLNFIIKTSTIVE